MLGVVFDVNECHVVSCGLDGNITPELTRTIPTVPDYGQLLDQLCQELQAVRKLRGVKCFGVGATVPGLLNRQNKKMMFSPNMHFLDGQDLAKDLTTRLRLPVSLLQEDYALCIAERIYGGARMLSDFVVVEMTCGLGTGVFTGGQFMSGSQGFAGEIGHTLFDPQGPLCGCGKKGCLEMYATDYVLLRAMEAAAGRSLTFDQLVEETRAERLDPAPHLEPVVNGLAVCVSKLINVFNPQAVFLHGRLFEISDDILPRLRERTSELALSPSFAGCRIERSQVNKRLGAVAGLIQHLYNQLGPRVGSV